MEDRDALSSYSRPMETTAQQEVLKRLSRYFQERLKPQANVTPLQVQCAMKDTLMVLIQHPPGSVPPPEAVFGEIEQTIALPSQDLADLMTDISTSTIKLYLRVLGQQKPYAFHHVEYVPIPAAPLVNPHSWENEFAALSTELPEPDFTPDPPMSEPEDSETFEETVELDHESNGGRLVHAPAPASIAQSLPNAETATANPFNSRSIVKPLLIGSGALAAFILLGLTGYAVTRPCVVGECQALQTAQGLSQQATQTVQTASTEEATQQATQQLTEAQRLLRDIPQWSVKYGEAHAFQQVVDQVLAAEAKAEAAEQKGQTTAQSVTDWQTSQSLWREAIAQLEAIPTNSLVYGFAQKRLGDYRANLAFVNQRIINEQDAQKRLVTGRKTAELATARQNIAQALPEWQQAQVTWQLAMGHLRQIPNGTTSYAEAQQLLTSYQTKFDEVRNRTSKEQLANRSYTQAVNLEKQAVNLQQRNQWSQAIATWRNALTAAKQIPNGTSVYDESQNKIALYTTSLKQAETVLKIRGDLDNICFAAGRICNYIIKNDAIEIRFVPTYERKVRTLGGLSWSSGDYEAMYQIDKHFATLGSALQAVSTNSGLPIRIYNSDNDVVGTLIPGQ